MNEQQIRQLIQQEIRGDASRSRFNLTSIPRHTHNNIDSPFIFQPIITYIGFIPSSGDITNPNFQNLVPKGWQVEKSGTGGYRVVHNLKTVFYAVVASAQQSTNEVVSPVIQMFDDSFYVYWYNTVPTAKDTSFTFLMTVINNRSQQLPSYTGTLAT